MQLHRSMLALLSRFRWIIWRFCIATLSVGSVIIMTYHLAPAADVPPPPGLTIAFVEETGQKLVITSPHRFELHLDASGIMAWYDLQRDELRRNNLVATDAHLLEHRPNATEPPLSGTLTLEHASPVRAQITWVGQAGTPDQSFNLTYTIWAGGQIAVATQSDMPLRTSLRLNPQSITGATLQAGSRRTAASGGFFQEYMLYLDAWSGELQADLRQGDEPLLLPNAQTRQAGSSSMLATPVYDPRSSALLARAMPEQSLRLELPDGLLLRNPRFIISNWSNPDFNLRRGEDRLIAGKDYLASWDANQQELTLQYLHPVVTNIHQAENSFEFIPQAGEPTLGLDLKQGSQLLNLDNGQLWIDANLSYLAISSDDQKTTLDLFKIPYIQSSNQVTAVATLQDAPAGAGVQFVLHFKETADSSFPVAVQNDLAAPYEQTFTLPTYGEYILDAYILDSQQQPLNQTADDTIDPLGYGHIIVTIGDSITAGKWGYTIDSNSTRYPVDNCRADLTQNERSTDCRNFPQYDNKLLQPSASEPTNFFVGYQVDLNDDLRTCKARPLPVFILNDGISGITTADVNSRLAQYKDHIDKLDADYTLIQLGTNDANEGVSPEDWRSNMDAIIDDLQSARSTLNIWLPRLPPRYNSVTANTRISEYNDLVADLINDQGVNTREGPDFFALFADQVFGANGSELMDADRLHPNIAGLSLMADSWADTICGILPDPGPIPSRLEPTANPTTEPTNPTTEPTANPTTEPTTNPTDPTTDPPPIIKELYLPLVLK